MRENHSDIGGSYVENEARLSDITMRWMLEELNQLPHPIYMHDEMLHLYPSPAGPAARRVQGVFPGGVLGKLGLKWKAKVRTIDSKAPLHPSVLETLRLPEVLDFDLLTPYRPEALRNHVEARQFFGKDGA